MKVGFTGTQWGMSPEQKESLAALLEMLDPDEFHHGDCVGADKEAHEIAFALGLDIIIHPPLNPKKRANCPSYPGITILEPKEYLDRNRDIVDSTDVLIGAPNGYERVRSGTWYTIRYARSQKKRYFVLRPEGESM